MQNELLYLYDQAITTDKPEDIVAYKEAAQRIGPSIAIDLLIENEILKSDIEALAIENYQLISALDNLAQEMQYAAEKV